MEQLFKILFEHIDDKVQLNEKDKALVMNFFKSKKLRKRQYLLQEGDMCKYISFVAQGLMKSYTVDEKGNEHINLFAWEGWWISDFASFIFGNEAKLNIDTIEDTTLLLLSRENYEKMLYQNSLATKDSRLISANTHTAEEKYAMFLDTYPSISQRLPQNLIASYLGLSPETISRIKRRMIETNT